jgi:hypothetical protein
MKDKIEIIIKDIDSRNWRECHPLINPIYNDIVKLTHFLCPSCKLNERFYCILNNIESPVKCQTCKTNIVKYTHKLNGYKPYCSHKCSAINEKTKNKAKQTCLKKYGKHPQQIKEIRLKAKQTCLKKYGTEYATQSLVFKENRNKTCLKKYGTKEYASSQKFQDNVKTYVKKYKQTCISKYGVENPQQSNELKLKWKHTRLKNFYKKIKKQITDYELLVNENHIYTGCKTIYNWKCKKCNNIFEHDLRDGKRPICRICYPAPKSVPQNEIYNYINNLNIEQIITQNTKSIIKNFELDIYIPSKKIAIEFNGNYWHSEIAGHKDRQYHLNKTELCKKSGIQLIHIFEDEWINKQQIVKNRLKHILGYTKYKLHGRKCSIKIINTKTKNKFLNKYHIQGEDKSKIKLGAFYKDRLVAVMTFGKRKITGAKTQEWELIRYCTIGSFNCIGVAGKLLKYFEKTYKPEKIISYADRRWSQGNLYHQLGFKLDHISSPNYWYLNQKDYFIRHNRIKFQKHKLQNLLEIYDGSLSEWENLQLNKHDRIWDCGNFVFIK